MGTILSIVLIVGISAIFSWWIFLFIKEWLSLKHLPLEVRLVRFIHSWARKVDLKYAIKHRTSPYIKIK